MNIAWRVMRRDPLQMLSCMNLRTSGDWGRDYGDVSPLYGVIQGGGNHVLNVAVDIEEIPA